MTDFVFSNMTGVNFRVRTDLIAPKTTTAQNLTIMQTIGVPVGIPAIDGAILDNIRTGLQYQKNTLINFATAQGFNLDEREIGGSDTYTRLVTATTPPPATFTVTPDATLHQIALAWTAPTGLVLQPGTTILYTVTRATNVGFTTGVTVVVNGVNELSFEDTGLAASTQYFYKITAQVTNSNVSSALTGNGTTHS